MNNQNKSPYFLYFSRNSLFLHVISPRRNIKATEEPMAEHYDLGKWGEEQAALYLKKKGWYIRHRDWHNRHRDIDIVAIDQDSSILLVVEVKTRSSEVWGNPDEAIDEEKKNNIIRATAAT